MGKTIRATEPLAFSFQIWPRIQLIQKEVAVSIAESILQILSGWLDSSTWVSSTYYPTTAYIQHGNMKK